MTSYPEGFQRGPGIEEGGSWRQWCLGGWDGITELNVNGRGGSRLIVHSKVPVKLGNRKIDGKEKLLGSQTYR